MPTRRKTAADREPRRDARPVPAPAVPADEEIARRAYELFVERGREHGRDWDDWLSAERELLAAPRAPAGARSAGSGRLVASRSQRGAVLGAASAPGRNKPEKPASA